MKAPVGLLSDRTILHQQDGGASPRQALLTMHRMQTMQGKTRPSRRCAKVCGHPENGKSHEESCDSSWDFGALEGTRIPGPLIKRAYFDGFLYPNLFQNARFDDIFAQLRPVSAPHAFSSCRIFVALFCRTITSTFFHQP